QVRPCIVNYKTCREFGEHERENPRQHGEDLLLCLVFRLGVELLLHPHGQAIQQRPGTHHQKGRRLERQQPEEIEHVRQIRRGQIVDPAPKWRMAHVDGDIDYLIQRKEDRNLQQDRQTAAGRIDLLTLVHFHDFALELLFVVRVFFLEGMQFGPQILHPVHRAIGFVLQREKHDAYKNRQQQKRDTEAYGKTVFVMDIDPHERQKVIERLGQDITHAEIDRQLQLFNAQLLLIVIQNLKLLCAGK